MCFRRCLAHWIRKQLVFIAFLRSCPESDENSQVLCIFDHLHQQKRWFSFVFALVGWKWCKTNDCLYHLAKTMFSNHALGGHGLATNIVSYYFSSSSDKSHFLYTMTAHIQIGRVLSQAGAYDLALKQFNVFLLGVICNKNRRISDLLPMLLPLLLPLLLQPMRPHINTKTDM